MRACARVKSFYKYINGLSNLVPSQGVGVSGWVFKQDFQNEVFEVRLGLKTSAKVLNEGFMKGVFEISVSRWS